MKILPKEAKIDVGVIPQAINNNLAVGPYYHMGDYRRAMAVLLDGAAADGTTTTLEILQATSAAGAGAKGIPGDPPSQQGIAVDSANTQVTEATLTVAAVQVGDQVTINDVTFTGAAVADLPNNVFLANPADDGATADSLAAAINHANGVEGITATSDAIDTVTLTVTDAGEEDITIENAAATITPATTQSLAYVDIDVSQLDLANDFEYIAVRVTKTGNGIVGALLARYIPRYEPEQAVAASAIV